MEQRLAGDDKDGLLYHKGSSVIMLLLMMGMMLNIH